MPKKRKYDDDPSGKDLFFGLRMAGTSFGITTEILYKVYRKPDPVPLVLPVVAKTPEVIDKLAKITAEGRYQLVINRAFSMKMIRPSVVTAVSHD